MSEYNWKFDWNKISTLGKVRILVEQVVGAPSQEAISQAVADYIDSHPGALSPISQATKSALLDIAEHVAYIDANGQSYYNALDAALNAKALLSITAVYTQSGTVYDTDSLDSLKDDLVVTAYYDDGTTADVTSASVLSGTLAEGTSTVTVTFGTKTATFTVTVTSEIPTQYTWLYQPTDGLLSAQSYVTASSSGTASTETVVDDVLRITTPTASGSSVTYIAFDLTDTTTTNGVLTAKVNLTSLAGVDNSVTGAAGFRLQLSNGTGGAQMFLVQRTSTGEPLLLFFEGQTLHSVSLSAYDMTAPHRFELRLQNGVQSCTMDDVELFNTSTLSTYYCTVNRVMNQGGQRNGPVTTTEISWMTYYEEA